MSARITRFDRLVVRLVLVTLVAGVAAAVIGTGLLLSSGRASLREDLKAEHERVAIELALRVDGRLESVLSTLRVVATRPRVADMSPEAGGDLAAVLRASDRFDELVLRDATGKPIAAAAERFLAVPGHYDPGPDLIEAAVEGDVVRLTAGDPAVLELHAVVENPPGVPVGTLTARAPLEVILHGVLRAPLPGEPVRYLVDGDGRIAVHPDRDRVVTGEEVDLSSLGELPAAESVTDGRKLLRAAAPLERFAGSVVVEQSEQLALAPVDARVRDLVTILIAVIGSAVIAISIVGGYLLRPLGPLAASIAQLGRARRGVRAEKRGSGEIAVLTTEFNRLADALEDREREVEELQRVSLLLHRHGGREELAAEVVSGASAILEASATQLWEVDVDGAFRVVMGDGDLTAVDAAQALARRAMNLGAPQTDNADSALGAFPVTDLDGRATAAIVVARPDGWDERDVQLGEALAAVAGVALENVRRLDLERQLADQLQEAADRRRDFMGTVTHEFRTPLTCIEGFSSLLLEGWDDRDDEERRLLVQKIHRHSEELDDLVGRLLDFAVTERGTLTAVLGPVHLAPQIDEVVTQLAPLLAGRTVARDVHDLVVEADPVLLRRTLTNLLSNAVKYSGSGAPVTIRTSIDGDVVRVSVTDAGVGMTTEDVERAFTPFWRAGNASTRGTRGAGIGLSLVAEYVRTMGGRVEVESHVGRGSTFAFTLRTASS